MFHGCTNLPVLDQWPMIGRRYVADGLHVQVQLFRRAVGEKFLLIHNNTPWQGTHSVQDCLRPKISIGLTVQYIPMISISLKMYGMSWDEILLLDDFLPQRRNSHPAVKEEWGNLPQQLLNDAVLSMLCRVESGTTFHGIISLIVMALTVINFEYFAFSVQLCFRTIFTFQEKNLW